MSEEAEFEELNTFGANVNLFRNDGKPLKFYIQDPPTIDEENRAELARKIIDHGGQVMTVIPRRGIIIYNAKKPKSFGARWSDTPLRTVVHMSWIDKCIETDSVEDPDLPMDDEPEPIPSTELTVPLEKRILMDMVKFGSQLPVHLHYSIQGPQRSKLCKRIEEYGGFCAILRCQARVILVDMSEDILEEVDKLRNENWNSDVYVEDKHTLERWIESGNVQLTRAQRKGMPGRRAGSVRVEFTPEDDAILVAHIARQIPDADSGGRLGNNLYQMLVSRLKVDAQRYAQDHDTSPEALAIQHAAAHPYQGWRERYRNNQKWIDERIEVWLDRHSWVRERGGDFPRAIGHERTLRAKPSVKSTTTPRKRKAAEPQTSEREENEDEDEDEDLIHPPGRSPNKRQRRQTVGEKGAEAPATEGAAQEDVRAPIDGDADVRPLRRAVPHSTAPSEPPPTYRTAVQLSSPAGKGRRGLAVPKYRQATSLPDGDWPPPRMTKGTVEIQMPTSPITPRERSQAPEPPTPHSPPVARSTPRGAPSVSPVLLRAPIQSIIPPAGSFNQSNGEADSELLEVEAELGDGAEQASQEAVPAQDNVGQTASTESSRATPETPTPEPGLQQLLEQAEALTIDGLVRPIGPRASDPLPRIRQMDFSELPADQTRYPGDPSRASTTATLGNTRRSGGRASINDIMQRAAQERQDMIEDLRRAHGYYFDVSAVSEVLLETADNYERADDVLTAMRQAADETRARASRRTESDGNDFRPAPGTRAAVVRRVQDEVEQVFETPRTVRRTRATVAAGLIRT